MTPEPLQVLPLDGELSVVAARRRARELSEAFAFSQHDQIRIATSVLEVARVVFLATSGGRVEFLLDKTSQPQSLVIRFVAPATPLARLTEQPGQPSQAGADAEPDAPETPGPLGILAAQRLMDACSVENAAGGPIIDASPLVSEHLFGTSSAGWSDHFAIEVTVVAATTPLGIWATKYV